jgi:hypothetical protein
MPSKILSKRILLKSKMLVGLFVFIFAGIGTFLILSSHAATPAASLNADKGTLDGGATIQTDSNADDGKYVLFGNSSSGSSGKIPVHVETWVYDDGCNGGKNASTALVDKWVTYAEAHCGYGVGKDITDCHVDGVTYCDSLEYLDTDWEYVQGSEPVAASASENWWLHEPGYSDSAHRIYSSSYGGGNVINQTNTAADIWFQNLLHTDYNSYDGLFMDDQGSNLSGEFYYAGGNLSSSQEITTNAQLMTSHEQMSSYKTHTDGSPFALQVDNSLSPNPYITPPWPMLNKPAGVKAFVSEGNPGYNGSITNYYPSLLDDMSYIDNETPSGDFIVFLSYDSNGALNARRVQSATTLLGYEPGRIVSWSDLEQDSGDLAVWPEEGIYPTEAVQTMSAPAGNQCMAGSGVVCSTGGHSDIQVASGVYRREFKDCYNQGTSFGSCASIVNDTGNPITVQSSWLTQSYHHEITMIGGDVQSGGTIDLTGAGFTPGSTSIPADDALLLAP